MLVLYPPVLENTAHSIPANENHAKKISIVTTNDTAVYDCVFQLPNSVTQSSIKHIQVSLKTANNSKPAVNAQYSPDQATLFLDTATTANKYFVFDTSEDYPEGIYHLYIPYELFSNGAPITDTEYSVQVRFGSNALWLGVNSDEWAKQNSSKTAFTNFATWKKNATNHIPSNFGEWSNLQSLYCSGNYSSNLTYNVNDLVPELIWTYYDATERNFVNIVNCKFKYNDIQHSNSLISHEITLDNIASDETNHTYTYSVKLPIAPIAPITCTVSAVTVYNTIISNEIKIPSIISGEDFNLKLMQDLQTYELTGEEQNDGAIAKSYDFSKLPDPPLTPSRTDIDYYNLYRVNLYDFKTVKIKNQCDYGVAPLITGNVVFKDFSVAMGEEYFYILVGYKGTPDTIIEKYILSKIQPYNSFNGAYGRLLDFGAAFLTTKTHQLRILGDVKISNFKRNVQDIITATIGSKYPFYNRIAKQNYRSLSLSCVVSIQFDPTSTFLRFVDNEGLWWDSEDESQLLIWDDDLFSTQQISLSRKRLHERNQTKDKISGVDTDNNITNRNDSLVSSSYYVNGPRTIFTDKLYAEKIKNISTDQTGVNIFAERQFRDKVMEWLSDGQPKLFRSETEGNMIVIISGVSFSPYEASNRMLYSMSCTLTEIAEATLDNCLLYNLLPTEFIASYIELSPYDFNPGASDPYVTGLITYNDSESFDIPISQTGREISPINTIQNVYGGSGDFTFSATGLPDGVTIDANTGIISGTPTTVAAATTAVLTCTDNSLGCSDSIEINVGEIYEPLRFVTALDNIPASTEGDVITPIEITKPAKITGGYGKYRYYLEDAPAGLTITTDELTSTGTISGSLDTSSSTGSFIVKCIDEQGNVATTTITYGDIAAKLKFNKMSYFDISATVVNEAITPIDFSVGVSGGTGTYTYGLINAPAGMTIDNTTGVLSFTPAAGTECSGGTFEVVVTDANGDSASVTCSYGTIYEAFTFDDISAKAIPTMALGSDLVQIDVFKNADGTYNVHGGIPYSDQPPYRFVADNLEPDYTIDNYGVITGSAVRTCVDRTAIISVYDSRGNVVVRRPLNVGAITDSMSYKKAGITKVIVGDTSVNTNYTSYEKVENGITSSVSSNTFLIKAENFENAGGAGSAFLTWTTINVPFNLNMVRVGNDYQFTFVAPTAQHAADKGYIQFSDNAGGIVNIPIEYGTIHEQFQFTGTLTTIPELSVGQSLNPQTFNSLVGGVQFTTSPTGYRFDDDSNIKVVTYNDGTGAKDTGLRIAIINSALQVYGTALINVNNTFTYSVTIKDSLGQTVSLTFDFSKIYSQLKLNFLGNDLHKQVWVIGKTNIPILDDTAPSATYDTDIALLKILKASGGKPPYTYGVQGGFASPDLSLATLKETSAASADNTVGVIQASNPLTVANVTQKDYLNNDAFYVIDALGQQVFCTKGASDAWWNPKIINEITGMSGAALDLGYYYYGTTQTSKRLWNLQGLPTSAGTSAYVIPTYTMSTPSPSSVHLISNAEYFSYISDSPLYPDATGYCTTGTLTAVRYAPDNPWTPSYTLNITYGIRGFVEHLGLQKLSELPAIDLGTAFTLQLGTNYTVTPNVKSTCLNIIEYSDASHVPHPRGIAPYTWTFVGLPSGVTATPSADGTYVTLSGTINSDITGQHLIVKVTDAANESVQEELDWATYSKLQFNYIPTQHDIPAHASTTTIADINYSTQVSGGKPAYQYAISGTPSTYLTINSTTGVLTQTGTVASGTAATTLNLIITDGSINGKYTQVIQVGAVGNALDIVNNPITWSASAPVSLTSAIGTYTGILTFSPNDTFDATMLTNLKLTINADGTLTQSGIPYGVVDSLASVNIKALDSISSGTFVLQVVVPVAHDNLTWDTSAITDNFDVDQEYCGSSVRSYAVTGTIPTAMNLQFDDTTNILSKVDTTQPIGAGTITFTMTDAATSTTATFTVTIS